MPLYSFLVQFMYQYVGHITFMLDSFLFLCLKDVDLFQVIAKLEGVAVSQYCALRLLQVALILKLYQSYIYIFTLLNFSLTNLDPLHIAGNS